MHLRLCLLFSLAFSGAVQATPFQLSVPSQAKGTGMDQSPCVLRLKSALKTLGYELQLHYPPSLRALQQASTGQIDGDVARSPMIETEYTNLRRVARPCAKLKPALYGLVDGPENWQQREIKKVAYFRGSSRLLSSLADSLKGYQLELTGSSEQGLKLLQAQRVDAVFLSKSLFVQVSQHQPGLVKGVVQLTPELGDVTLYTYLHKRHEGIIPQLDELMALDGVAAAP